MSRAPIENLTTPQPDDPVPDMVELATNANAVSPAYWLNGIIKTVTGFDALTTITDYVAGDWAAMQQAGAAIENLAKYNADYAVSMTRSRSSRHPGAEMPPIMRARTSNRSRMD
ncbi:hypothetical protein ACQPW1_47630 [Nocardia sp. CA-128927]|uniref:hypothetical protein n=1 Tax=Nocardia sp. CA-128927 TaxID=3239975 RepID=UPI003D987205